MYSNTTSLTSWSQLVRYLPLLNGTSVHWGEPVLPSNCSDIAALANQGQLEVEVLEGPNFLDAVRTGRRERVAELLGPLAPEDVPIVRCIGLNYKSHILESTNGSLPENPTVFIKPSDAVADFAADVPIPKIAQAQADYEGELVIVIGKDAKDVSEADALDYVAGYTVGDDVSARDWQLDPVKAGQVPQWSFSKGFDGYAPLGPVLVSSSVLGDAGNLGLKTWVNGELRQEGHTSDLLFGVKKLVAFLSQGQTLKKGSLVMTGTPGGVGAFMQPPQFLKDGDEVVVEIEKIGRIAHRYRFE